ncbi:MAG: FAD-dependent monooxygenase [Phycisphaerales bacterium]
MRIVVVGGGIAGLTAAIALRRAGHAVAVFERAPEPREVGAGISLAGNAMLALRAAGADDAVAQRGERLRRVEFRTWRGRVLAESDLGALDDRFGTRTIMLHRADLVGALHSLLPPGVVRPGLSFGGLAQRGGTVVARFEGGDGQVEQDADLLIGADGINSAVRLAMHGPEPVRYAGYTCWRGISLLPGIAPGLAWEAWGPGARLGMAPIGPGRTYWYSTVNAPPGGSDGPGIGRELGARFRRWLPPSADLIASTPEGAIIRNDIVDRRPRRGWSDGRVVLIGDAAHPTTPNLGQGGAMAIEDGVVLAGLLPREGDPGPALAAFERRRFARAARVTRESLRLGSIGQWRSAPARAVRDALFAATPGWVMDRQYTWLVRYGRRL